MDRPETHYAAAVWLVHGLLDGLVTVAAAALSRGSAVESNPVLLPSLNRAVLRSSLGTTTLGEYLPYAEPLLLKLGAVALAAGLLVVVGRAVPKRVFVTFSVGLTAAGLLVVGNNLLALRGIAL